MTNVSKKSQNLRLENRYFQLMALYLHMVRPFGFGDIPDNISRRATALVNKAMKITKRLGYPPTKGKPQPQAPNATQVKMHQILKTELG